MAKLVIMITAQIEMVRRIGDAWHHAGAPGITVIEGYGLQRLANLSTAGEVLPGALSMLEIVRENEPTSMVLLTLVDDAILVDSLQKETESILGDMRAPNNGIFFVIDVERAIGIQRHAAP
ncbi:MAG: hypothetical protein R3E39_20555 [Anaerolineae bacterium]